MILLIWITSCGLTFIIQPEILIGSSSRIAIASQYVTISIEENPAVYGKVLPAYSQPYIMYGHEVMRHIIKNTSWYCTPERSTGKLLPPLNLAGRWTGYN